MKEYTRKLVRHRMGVVSRILVCIFVVAAIVVGMNLYYANHFYKGYEVIERTEHSDAWNTRYAEYGENILRYSKDGISCLTLEHQPVWSHTFNMQEPVLDVCSKTAAVVDRGGNQLYIFDENGLTGEVTTRMPIQQVTVSRTGVTAVLLEDSEVSWIYIYDGEGTLLLDARCNLAETGQPLSLSLAPNGSKLAVSYLQIAGGTTNSCVVFYNLGSVGANFVDKIVSSWLYEDTLVPRVEYLDENTCVAVGEKGFYLFEGAEIPEEAVKQPVEYQIQSIAFGDEEFILVYEQEGEQPFRMQMFDEAGTMVLEQPFDLASSQIKISKKEIVLYNDKECQIYSKKGVLWYEGALGETLVNVHNIKGRRYLVIHPKYTEQIKLK